MKPVPLRVHFEIADQRERKSMVVTAESPADAKAQVQKLYGGLRLIFHKVKVDRSEGAA